jgi:hypothetical protein
MRQMIALLTEILNNPEHKALRSQSLAAMLSAKEQRDQVGRRDQ